MREQYYGETFAQAIMFTDDINSFLNKLDYMMTVIDTSFAGILEEIFEMFLYYSEQEYLTNEGKGNIYMFMHHISRMQLSYMANHKYREYYDRILNMLNGAVCDENVDEYYQFEIATRRNKRPELITPQKIKKVRKQINKSIEYDSELLFTHLDESEEKFGKKLITFVASPYYIESVRSLIKLYPTLLDDEDFKRRLCTTLEEHQNLGKKYTIFSLEKKNNYIGNIIKRTRAKKLYKQIKGEQQWI